MSPFADRCRRSMLAALLLPGVGASCPDAVAVSAPVALAEVRVEHGPLTLMIGATTQLRALAVDEAGAPLKRGATTWRVDEARVASVTPDGVLRALAAGRTRVIATIAGTDGAVDLTVRALPVAFIEIAEWWLDVPWGGTAQATVLAYDAQGRRVDGRSAQWSSSSSLVSVDSTGRLTGHAEGYARVTARVDDAVAETWVSVTNPCRDVRMTPPSVRLTTGSSVGMSATFLDGNQRPVTPPALDWWSTDTAVVRVSARGVVTAGRAGDADVYAACGSMRGVVGVAVR